MIYYKRRKEDNTVDKRIRNFYIFLSVLLFVVEVCIALFVRDKIVRPYVGDILVTLLLCSVIRCFIPIKIKMLSLYVFIFSAFVEIGQYFNYVKILRLDNIKFFSVLMGTSFSFIDIMCYALGCLLFVAIEVLLNKTHA